MSALEQLPLRDVGPNGGRPCLTTCPDLAEAFSGGHPRYLRPAARFWGRRCRLGIEQSIYLTTLADPLPR